MKHLRAALACAGIFITYGLVCLALGWERLGGALPTIALVSGLALLWDKMVSGDTPTDKQTD